MTVILGPVLTREGGYAFDAWTPQGGLSRGYVYPRIEDAYYARKAEIRAPGNVSASRLLACNTADEFTRATASLRDAFRKIWKNLDGAHGSLLTPSGSCNGQNGGIPPSVKPRI